MEERSIRVEIAGRAYPLTIGGEEEAHIRQVVTEINDSVTRLKEHYPLTDRQDLLAMAALEVATRALNSAGGEAREQVLVELGRLEGLLTSATG